MRTTLKIVLPLIISVVVVSLLFAVYQVRTEKRMERNELSRRAEILAESLQENVEPLFDRPLPDKSLQRIVDRFGQREHLKGIAVYNANGAVLALTPGLPTSFQTRPATATRAALRDAGSASSCPSAMLPMQLYAMPLAPQWPSRRHAGARSRRELHRQPSFKLAAQFPAHRAGSDAVHFRPGADFGALDPDRPAHAHGHVAARIAHRTNRANSIRRRRCRKANSSTKFIAKSRTWRAI